MLISLAKWLMVSRSRTLLVTFVTALFSPLFWLSTACLGLVALRFGWRQGTPALVAALTGSTIGFYLLEQGLAIFLVAPPVFVMATLLHHRKQWREVLMLTVVIGLLMIGVVKRFFETGLQAFLDTIFELIKQQPDVDMEQLEILFQLMREGIAVNMAMSVALFSLLILVLARWMQAGVYNPGGFRSEFHALRMTPILTGSLLVIGVGVWMVSKEAIAIVILPFVVSGIALLHYVIAKKQWGSQWLVGFYIALLLIGQILLPIMLIVGLVDSLANLRTRFGNKMEAR